PHAATSSHTLSLHDALPICRKPEQPKDNKLETASRKLFEQSGTAANEQLSFDLSAMTEPRSVRELYGEFQPMVLSRVLADEAYQDRKSTRLNSSHVSISYAV